MWFVSDLWMQPDIATFSAAVSGYTQILHNGKKSTTVMPMATCAKSPNSSHTILDSEGNLAFMRGSGGSTKMRVNLWEKCEKVNWKSFRGSLSGSRRHLLAGWNHSLWRYHEAVKRSRFHFKWPYGPTWRDNCTHTTWKSLIPFHVFHDTEKSGTPSSLLQRTSAADDQLLKLSWTHS